MDARLRRVNKEIADCKTSDIKIEMIDESPFHLKGSFDGPKGTPYEGGQFEIDIVYPESYPFQPVEMKFITKVFHPNISSASGAICLDILKDAWSPAHTLKSAFISLQTLLCSPKPDDPQDADVAKHYMESRTKFEETAAIWTRIYAGAPALEGRKDPPADTANAREAALAGLDLAHVDRFVWLGFPRTNVVEVLRRLDYRGKNINNISDDRIVEELLK